MCEKKCTIDDYATSIGTPLSNQDVEVFDVEDIGELGLRYVIELDGNFLGANRQPAEGNQVFKISNREEAIKYIFSVIGDAAQQE